MPVSADCAFAAYATHAISKMNATFGFELKTTFGVGRPPVSTYEQMRHLMDLGGALLAALERDFPRSAGGAPAHHRVSTALRGLSAEELTAVSQSHLQALYAYGAGLERALTLANREGEENRKAERYRIWRMADDTSD